MRLNLDEMKAEMIRQREEQGLIPGGGNIDNLSVSIRRGRLGVDRLEITVYNPETHKGKRVGGATD